MLRKVRSFPYEMPLSFSPPLALLITEVITQIVITLLLNIQLNTTCTSVYHLLPSSSTHFSVQLLCKTPSRRLRTLERFKRQSFFYGTSFDLVLLQRQPVEVTVRCLDVAISVVRFLEEMFIMQAKSSVFFIQVILQLRERPDRAAKARRGLTLSLQPLKGFDYDSFLSPPATPDTHLDAGTQSHRAAPLPGPTLPLQPAQEKGQRREVFV